MVEISVLRIYEASDLEAGKQMTGRVSDPAAAVGARIRVHGIKSPLLFFHSLFRLTTNSNKTKVSYSLVLKMRERDICLTLLILFSLVMYISIVQSSKLKAVRLVKHAVRHLRKIKTLAPALLMVRKVPIIIVVKKNCNHPLFPELGLGGEAFAGSNWLPDPNMYPDMIHSDYVA